MSVLAISVMYSNRHTCELKILCVFSATINRSDSVKCTCVHRSDPFGFRMACKHPDKN